LRLRGIPGARGAAVEKTVAASPFSTRKRRAVERSVGAKEPAARREPPRAPPDEGGETE